MGEMKMTAVGVIAVVVMVMAMGGVASAQTVAEQYLTPHNDARQAVQAGLPDLTWNTQLEAYATSWATDRANNAACKLSHSGGPYGENIYWSSGASTPAAAVTAWVNEKQNYNYTANTCAANKVCGHYTQVVWKNTLTVGCGSANCVGGGKFVVCSYDPPGNVGGQKPYLQSDEGGLIKEF